MTAGGIAFIDTETTGLDPDRHEIWEVGLILPDGSERSWQLPVNLGRADPIALNIGRFHDRRHPDVPQDETAAFRLERTVVGDPTTVAHFVVPCDYMPEWAATFVDLTRGLHLAGAVISFDTDRLWRLLRRLGECPMWHYHVIDVEALAAGWLAGRARGLALAQPPEGPDCSWTMRNTEGGPESVCTSHGNVTHKPVHSPSSAHAPWKSYDLSLAVGVDPLRFDRHTALGDARWAKAIYESVLGPHQTHRTT